MKNDQQAFADALEQLRDTARLQDNMLTSAQIAEVFDEWQLDDAKLSLIHDYLKNSSISIDGQNNAQDNTADGDRGYLNMYLGELKKIPNTSDGETRAVIMSALAGDNTAKDRLTEIFLPNVVEISKLYAGQGALVEDLIGEGNVAVAMAVNMLDCVEGVDEVEGFIGKMIMDAMEDYINENSDSARAHENVLKKVNKVNDKAKEMYDSLMRKVTVKEVADELGTDEEEVRAAVRFSANHIDYIEGEGDGRQI